MNSALLFKVLTDYLHGCRKNLTKDTNESVLKLSLQPTSSREPVTTQLDTAEKLLPEAVIAVSRTFAIWTDIMTISACLNALSNLW